MNTEAESVVVEEASEGNRQEASRTEPAMLVELGQVVRDTQGFGSFGWDGGFWFRS